MKKSIFIASLALGSLFTSCAKDYSCECKVTHEQSAPGFSETKSETKTHSLTGKEDDVKTECRNSGYDISYTDGGGYAQKINSECAVR